MAASKYEIKPSETDLVQSSEPLAEPALKSFLHKWLIQFARVFEKTNSETAATAQERSPEEENAEAAGEKTAPTAPTAPKKAFSVIITKILNVLYWPFIAFGIAFIAWILCDFILSRVMDPSQYAALRNWVAPWEVIIGSAAIGFWTNWLAIKMIFHPRKRNLVWQGLIPARREELVNDLAKGISEKLFSGSIAREALEQSGILRDVINRFIITTGYVTRADQFRDDLKLVIRHEVANILEHPDTKQTISEIVGNVIDNWGGAGLEGWIIRKIKPLIRTWVQDQVVNILPGIPDSMDAAFNRLDESLDTLPSYLVRESAGIESLVIAILEKGLDLINVQAIISTQLGKMDESQLEELLTKSISVEIRFIQTSGGIFGGLVACAVQFPILRPVLLLLGLGLWGLYLISVDKTK